jgi:hypothetical protein
MVFCSELAPVIPMLLPGAKKGNPVTEKKSTLSASLADSDIM